MNEYIALIWTALCGTTELPPHCPIPQLFESESIPFTTEDCKTIQSMYEGCDRHMGPPTCAIKIYKTGEHDFNVICKKFPKKETI